ncbi:MAG: hypothetical protein AB1490_15700 [Pseudomonadota bacterium]
MRKIVLALAAVAALGLALPMTSAPAEAKNWNRGHHYGWSKHHWDRGRHRGWYRGHHYGWNKHRYHRGPAVVIR